MNGLIMKYFVLNPGKNDAYGEASKRALKTYAASISSENEDLSMDIVNWLRELESSKKVDEEITRKAKKLARSLKK